jgi:hypothetical protein
MKPKQGRVQRRVVYIAPFEIVPEAADLRYEDVTTVDIFGDTVTVL